MTSSFIMKSLLVVYSVICIVSLFEKNYPRASYWFGAGIITFSVLWGTK